MTWVRNSVTHGSLVKVMKPCFTASLPLQTLAAGWQEGALQKPIGANVAMKQPFSSGIWDMWSQTLPRSIGIHTLMQACATAAVVEKSKDHSHSYAKLSCWLKGECTGLSSNGGHWRCEQWNVADGCCCWAQSVKWVVTWSGWGALAFSYQKRLHLAAG